MKKSQKGFAALEVLLVVVAVVIVALIGYRVVSNHNTKASNQASTSVSDQSKVGTDVTTVPEINNKSDLDKAAAALNQSDNSTDDNHDSNTLNSSADF